MNNNVKKGQSSITNFFLTVPIANNLTFDRNSESSFLLCKAHSLITRAVLPNFLRQINTRKSH